MRGDYVYEQKVKNKVFICFLLIFAIIYPCKRNIEASELNKGVEIICVSNDNKIKSLENMESLLNGDFANKEFVEIKEPISVYNADSNDIFFIYPVMKKMNVIMLLNLIGAEMLYYQIIQK